MDAAVCSARGRRGCRILAAAEHRGCRRGAARLALAESESVSEAEFRNASGEHLTLADFRGRVVLLAFWYPT